MLLQAQNEFDIDMKASLFVGDKPSDMQAGLSAGVGSLILIDPELKKGDDFKSFADLRSFLDFLKLKEEV